MGPLNVFHVSLKFLKFCTVGGIGAGVQSVVFYALTRYAGVPDFVGVVGVPFQVPWALGWAIAVAVSWNFVGNYLWTFREGRR